MAESTRVICQSDVLIEKGQGIRFDLPEFGEGTTGFVVRFEGKPFAYLNRCAHVPIELDWNHGDFFNIDKQFLICATHGAHYAPETGFCVLGPCKGMRLISIPVIEDNQQISIDLAKFFK